MSNKDANGNKNNGLFEKKDKYMDSEEKGFLDMIGNTLNKAQEKIAKIDEDCRIALIFEENGHSCIKQFLSTHHHSQNVSFERNRIYNDTCNYDVRIQMDNDFINEIANMGYSYDAEKSTSEVLFFINIQTTE